MSDIVWGVWEDTDEKIYEGIFSGIVSVPVDYKRHISKNDT